MPTSPLSETLGQRLLQLRNRHEWSQGDLAARVGTTAVNISGHYGRDAERLKQFQINPRRTKTKPRVAPEPPPLPEDVESNKKPSEPGPNPTQTAASETDGTTWEVKV